VYIYTTTPNPAILHPPAYEDGTDSSETSASNTQTPGIYPKESELHLQHGENSNLKSRILVLFIYITRLTSNEIFSPSKKKYIGK
jgi:hypothetical protein